MAEIGLIASVIQVASTGVELSISLYSFAESVSTASKTIKGIADDVKFTAAVLEQFRDVLNTEKTQQTASREALDTADDLVKECSTVFKEIEALLQKHFIKGDVQRLERRKVTFGMLKWPFLQPKIELLRSNLEKHKTKLVLMAQVLAYAKMVAVDRRQQSDQLKEDRIKLEALVIANRQAEVQFQNIKISTTTSGFHVSRFGLTEVFKPKTPIQVDVVFVHGLYGHPKDTWTNDETGVCWPYDLLPPILEDEGVRILLYGFESSTNSFTKSDTEVPVANSLYARSQRFIQDLIANRRIRKAEQRPLLFVAHSLGGLLVKATLITSSSPPGPKVDPHRSVFLSTFGIIFLATPHSFHEDQVTILHRVTQSSKVSGDNLALDISPSVLNMWRATYEHLETEFRQICAGFKICCFYELSATVMTTGKCMVISKEAALLKSLDVEINGIYSTHMQICKFGSDNAPGFDVVCDAIQRLSQDAPDCIHRRWHQANMERKTRTRFQAVEPRPELIPNTTSSSMKLVGDDSIQYLGSFDSTSPTLRADDEYQDFADFKTPCENDYDTGDKSPHVMAELLQHRSNEQTSSTTLSANLSDSSTPTTEPEPLPSCQPLDALYPSRSERYNAHISPYAPEGPTPSNWQDPPIPRQAPVVNPKIEASYSTEACSHCRSTSLKCDCLMPRCTNCLTTGRICSLSVEQATSDWLHFRESEYPTQREIDQYYTGAKARRQHARNKSHKKKVLSAEQIEEKKKKAEAEKDRVNENHKAKPSVGTLLVDALGQNASGKSHSSFTTNNLDLQKAAAADGKINRSTKQYTDPPVDHRDIEKPMKTSPSSYPIFNPVSNEKLKAEKKSAEKRTDNSKVFRFADDVGPTQDPAAEREQDSPDPRAMMIWEGNHKEGHSVQKSPLMEGKEQREPALPGLLEEGGVGLNAKSQKATFPPEDDMPSKNKVRVANLPYNLNEEKLKELFAPYNPSAAKIAPRPEPSIKVPKLQSRNEPRQGRGFGFVTFESGNMQRKAIKSMHGKEIDGRKITVEVAIDSLGKEEDLDAEAAGMEPMTENDVFRARDPPAAVPKDDKHVFDEVGRATSAATSYFGKPMESAGDQGAESEEVTQAVADLLRKWTTLDSATLTSLVEVA